jgi:hypothetical protein
MVFVVIGGGGGGGRPPWLRHCQLAEQQRHLGCEQQAFEYMTSFAVLSASCVQVYFVKDFDKALSKYCLFDLFSAIKHKRKEV